MTSRVHVHCPGESRSYCSAKDAAALAYDRLVAVLVEAMKEQDARIAELEQTVAQNKRLEQRLETLERLVQQRQTASVDEQVRP